MADKESLTHVKTKTGIPGKGFIGWDPRLTTDDIKIKTLSIGGEDLRRFGFWDKDEKRMQSLAAAHRDMEEVTTRIESIKASIKSARNLKLGIERTMFESGFKVNNITFVDSDHSSLQVREER